MNSDPAPGRTADDHAEPQAPAPAEQPRAPGVAIVGVGAVTALGPTARDLWQGARAGRVEIRPVQGVDMSGLDTKLGGEVDTPVHRHGRAYRRPAQFRERALDLAIVAAEEALSALPPDLADPEHFAVVLGTCNGGLRSAREWMRAVHAGEAPDPLLAQMVTPQALAESVAAAFGLRGAVLGVNTACASGSTAIGLAADLLRHGRAEAVLVGGTDAFCDVIFAGFNALQALAAQPARPYSADREGLSLGEGSGMLVLVRSDLAERRGLRTLTEVAGYGLSADGFHATAPHPEGEGAEAAIRAALRHAGVAARDIAYVNGHGTGTAKNDPAESRALLRVLGPERAGRTPVSSTKATIGHLLGAAGAVEAIVTAHALAEQVAPPTAGYTTPDPDCPLDYVPGDARPMAPGVAVSTNFGFGGANAALVLAPRGHRPPLPLLDDIVVTGVAVTMPSGNDVAALWAAYEQGSEPGAVEDGMRLARVDFDPEPHLNRRDRRRMDRLGILSVVTAAKALTAAGLEPDSAAARPVGVVFGTGTGPSEALERFTLPVLDDGVRAADPSVFPNTVYNQAAGQIALHLGLRGPTSTLSVGHATGAAVVGHSADLLAAGHADAVLCTVTDTLTPYVARAYADAGAASPRAVGAPPDGRFVLAEGSVALVFERRSAALARGAHVLGSILGYGMASDASKARLWDPRGRGLERAMRAALHDASLDAAELGGVWLAAAGLDAADRAESAALDRLFADAGTPPLHGPKRVLGEPMGAGAALTLALALHHVRRGGAPALVNSSSLGGTHISIAVQGPDPDHNHHQDNDHDHDHEGRA